MAENISNKLLFWPKIIPKKNIFAENISKKIFSKKKLLPNKYAKKGGGEAPLLPAGPRLISSDSEISA